MLAEKKGEGHFGYKEKTGRKNQWEFCVLNWLFICREKLLLSVGVHHCAHTGGIRVVYIPRRYSLHIHYSLDEVESFVSQNVGVHELVCPNHVIC